MKFCQSLTLTVLLSLICLNLTNGLDIGMWQELPLKCNKCNDENSCKTPTTEKCLQNDDPCVTVFDNKHNVIKRGCHADIFKDNCENNKDNKCYECKSNECNIATSEDEYVQCYECSSFDNKECLNINVQAKNVPLRECYKSCMTTLVYLDETNTTFEVVRSCLDDKDKSDQNLCNTEKHCKACNENKCNIGIYPEDRLKCYYCKGQECTRQPKSKACTLYVENDKCFIEYDTAGVVLQQGCLSDLNHDLIKDKLIDNLIYICNGNDCNLHENLPKGTTCNACQSNNIRECITDIKNGKVPTETCDKLPNTKCFTRYDNTTGLIERGCWAKIQDRKLREKCLDEGNDENCNLCTGYECNKEAIPEDRKSCLACDSKSDPSCEGDPKKEELCFNYKKDDICVSKYVGGKTTRGCSNDIGTCKGLDNYSCKLCSGENCNKVDLKSIVRGDMGMWQDLPLKCKACQNVEDCAKEKIEVTKCTNNFDQCITIFNNNNQVEYRGCSSSISEIDDKKLYCDTNPELCPQCKSNECNIATSKDQYVQCYECSSFDNKECSNINVQSKNVTVRECYKSCMTTLVNLDETNITFEVIRSCLDDKDKSDQNLCNTEKHCKSCNDNKCNIGIYPEDRLKCYHCKGQECMRQPKSKVCTLYVENDKCFIDYDTAGVELQQGCLSDLNQDLIKDKLIDNLIFICNGTDCNVRENLPKSTICNACQSNNTRECITDIKNDKVLTETCDKQPNTKCFTRYDNVTGLIERGCWAKLLDRNLRETCLNGNAEICNLCAGDECNKEAIPEDRKSCLACDSKSDPSCEGDPKKEELCFNYKKDDICVSKYVDGKTTRGCSNDIGTCKGLDNYSCKLCSGENCNKVNLKSIIRDDRNMGMWQDLPLKCKACQNVEDCAKEKVQITKCTNNFDQCITIFNNSKVEYRGCSSSISEIDDKKLHCDMNPELCPQCKSNECNIATSKDEYVKCHYCGWPDFQSCNANIKEENKYPTRECYKSCMTAAYNKTQDDEGIYNVIRTCLDDKEPEQQNDCKSDDKDNCKACDGNNCNSEILYDDWSSCYTCDNSEQCKTAPRLKLCDSYTDSESCFYLYNDKKEVIKGGCISALQKPLRYEFIINNKISFCSGSECNQHLPQDRKCLKCDSSKDEKCASEPDNFKEKLETCSVPNSNCYVKLENDTNIRGCMSDLKDKIFDCMNSEKCEHCNGEECNNMIYPKNRRKCFVCDSESNEECAEDPKNVKVCPVFFDSQQCVSKYTDGKTERGCSNDLDCDTADEKKCEKCDNENCNNKNLKKLNNSAMIVANSLLIGFLILIRGWVL